MGSIGPSLRMRLIISSNNKMTLNLTRMTSKDFWTGQSFRQGCKAVGGLAYASYEDSDASRIGIGRSSPENRLPPYLAKSVTNGFATAASQSNRTSTSSHNLVLLRQPHARPFSFPNNHNDDLNATHDSPPDRPTLFLAEGNYNNNPYRNRMGSGVGPT